jgi:gas vesicle protein
MSMNDTNSTGSKNGGLGAKVEGIVDQARDFGRDMKGQAGALTQSAADAVKTQAGNLQQSAKEVASDAGEKLRASVSEQKAAGADYVGNVANIIRRTAYEFDSDIPQAGHYIRKAAAQLENVSDAMRNRDMSEIVGNVQDFARKQPTAFLGAAVLLGFAAVRFLKSGSSATASAAANTTTQPNIGGTTAGM